MIIVSCLSLGYGVLLEISPCSSRQILMNNILNDCPFFPFESGTLGCVKKIFRYFGVVDEPHVDVMHTAQFECCLSCSLC